MNSVLNWKERHRLHVARQLARMRARTPCRSSPLRRSYYFKRSWRRRRPGQGVRGPWVQPRGGGWATGGQSLVVALLLLLVAFHLAWSPRWPWNASRSAGLSMGWLRPFFHKGPPAGGEQGNPYPGPVISLWDAEQGRLRTLPLEEYLEGVVAAEMPANFPLEALKAQAVAARTLALRALAQGVRIPSAPMAQLSSDYRSGQAWASPESLRRRWGPILWYFNMRKIRQAVAQTAGVVVVYQGELIFPAFHSTSGGRTEDSENYWATAQPYLRSVESPGEESSPYYRTRVVKSANEVATRLGVELAARGSTQQTALKMEVVSTYPSGRVQWVRLGGRLFSGREVREKLGLPSSWFTVRESGDQLIFDVRGYGHGVGMSQYGAAAMARHGQSFAQILTHYYTGVTLARAYQSTERTTVTAAGDGRPCLSLPGPAVGPIL